MKQTRLFFRLFAWGLALMLCLPNIHARAQIISTIAGNGTIGYSGDHGPAVSAELYALQGVVVMHGGNLYIADSWNHRIRMIDGSGTITTVVGNGVGTFAGDGGAAATASLYDPVAVGFDGAGNMYISDCRNNRIRKVNTAGIISTVAGSGSTVYSGDGGDATAAGMNEPFGIAVDTAGNIYFCDHAQEVIRKVTASGTITRIAGIAGSSGFSGDGGAALSAHLASPYGICLDNSGNILFCDNGNNRVRKIDGSGIITTVIGNGTAGFAGDGGPATAVSTKLNGPEFVAVDLAGNILFSDTYNNRIRRINTAGIVTTFAGSSYGYSGDGGLATAAKLSNPDGLDVDCAGNVFIGDFGNARVRKVSNTNSAPYFASGTSNNLSICTCSGSDTITSLLGIRDTDLGQTESWSVITAPSHGTLGGFPTSGTAGATTAYPTGLTYTPSCSGTPYSGTDSFRIAITDCASASDTITILVTVNPLPAAISGGGIICTGTSATLTDATAGGTWASTTTAVGTIGTAGIVSGLSVGTTRISYTLPTGCTATITETVTTLPAITGGASVCAGLTLTLHDGTTGGIWSSSDGSIASIGSLSGVAIGGTSGGTVTISYSTGACSTTESLTVNTAPPAISGPTYVCVGSSITLSDGLDGGTWSSMDGTIATVSPSGLVHGVSAGATAISYTNSCGSATQIVTVEPIPAPISGPSAVCLGNSATYTDGTGGTWSSSNPAVATIGSTTGILTTLTAGTTVLTYTSAYGCTTTLSVVVSTAGTISGTLTACVGASTTLSETTSGGSWSSGTPAVGTIDASAGTVTGLSAGSAAITYSVGSCIATTVVTILPTPSSITGLSHVCIGSGITLSDGTSGGTWATSDPTIATISGAGSVGGVAAGTVSIDYTLTDGCSTNTTVTVNSVPEAITGSPAICAGAMLTLSDPSGAGTWASSSTSITVGSASGIVSGVATGTATVTFTLTSTGCSVTGTVTVNPSPSALLPRFVHPYDSHICLGGTLLLYDPTIGGVWSSSDNTIATVGSTGLVNSVAGGGATISYTLSDGCSAEYTVTVIVLPPITAPESSCAWGSTFTVEDATPGGSWTSTLVTVGATGTCLTYGPGTAVITYTTPDGCFTSTRVIINPLPSEISVPSYICSGSSAVLSDTITGGTWVSLTPAIATVGSLSGIVTGVSAGDAIIDYILPTGCSGDTTVIVDPTPPAISVATDFCPGATELMTDALHGGVWSSSDVSVATIGSISGIATGIDSGVATISYTICGLSYATITVTVGYAPPAITGPDYICYGGTASYSDATPGYTWSASPGIISPTGVLTDTGASTIIFLRYGFDGSCYVNKTVFVEGHEGCQPCSALTPSGYSLLTSSTTGAGSYYMASDLNITGNVTYTDAVIYVAPNAHIYVKPRASLTLKGCHLFSCASGMWNGIVLQSAGGYSGQVVLTSDASGNGNLIEDATVAIDAENLVALPSGLHSTNFVDCYNTVFNRNDTGIKITGYYSPTTAPTNYPFAVTNTVFTGRYLNSYPSYPLAWPTAQALKNSVAVSSPYMAPYAVQSYTGAACHNDTSGHILTMGMYLGGIGTGTYPNYGSVEIGQPTPDFVSLGAPTLFNLFDTLNYGIDAVNSNLALTNNAFAHINKSAGVTGTSAATGGVGVYTSSNDNNFYCLNVARSTSGSGRFADTSINTFWNCNYGVYSLNYYHVLGTESKMVTTQSNATSIAGSTYGYYVQTYIWDTVNLSFNNIINVANGIAVLTPGGWNPSSGVPGQITVNNNNIRARYIEASTPLGTAYVDKAIWVENTIGYIIRLGSSYTNMVNTDNNTINDAYNGIYVNGERLTVATSNNNTVKVLQHPAFADTTMQYGIYHANCAGDNVYNSTVIGNNSADTAIKGVYEYGCVRPSITCNEVQSLGSGFEFEASTLNAKWMGNTMFNNRHGFVLGCVIGLQGLNTSPSDNYWRTISGSSFAWDGITNYQTFTVHSASPTASPLWVRGGIYTDPSKNWGTGFYSQMYGWSGGTTVTDHGNGLNIATAYSMPYRCAPIGLETGSTSVATGMVTQGLPIVHHRAQNYWNGQYAVWQAAVLDSALADTSAILASFQSLAASSRFAVLTWVENALATGDTATAQYVLNNYSLDSMANSENDTTTGVQMADDTTADAIVLNYRQFYQLYINYVEGVMSASDTAAVTGLASMCPITGGNVVFKARALYDLLNDTLAIFPDNCPDSVIFDSSSAAERMAHVAGVKAITDGTGQQYILYPNPNDGNFILKQGVQDAAPVKAEMLDMTGRVLFSDNLYFAQLTTRMEMHNATPGIYLLQLTDSKGQMYRFKFVVQ